MGDEIKASVGKGGTNNKDDVLIVQKLINKNLHRITGVARLAETGTADKKTIAAIEAFQRQVVGMTPPDGRVDPNGKTLKALNQGATEIVGGTLHLAWTVDDGPTDFTDDMVKVFKATLLSRSIPATWYIQLDYLKKRNRYKLYQELQKDGHEVAIHGISAIANHMHWFPTANKKHNAFASITEATDAIKEFKKHLSDNGIKVKFVRAPTGLHSEIMAYLSKLGVEKSKKGSFSRSIIKGKSSELPKDNKSVQKVIADYNTLKVRLKEMGLHLWGGDSTGAISAQSWEAETAGKGTGRADNVPTLPERLMKGMQEPKGRKSRSLVILCHDTTKADVEEVRADIRSLDQKAKEHTCEIKYHTMSSLYKQVVGKKP